MLAAPFEKADLAEWDAMIGTNVTGLLHTARAFIDDLLAAAAEGRLADLRGEDIAGAIAWSAVAPARMNVAEMVVVVPTPQG